MMQKLSGQAVQPTHCISPSPPPHPMLSLLLVQLLSQGSGREGPISFPLHYSIPYFLAFQSMEMCPN